MSGKEGRSPKTKWFKNEIGIKGGGQRGGGRRMERDPLGKQGRRALGYC